MNRVAVAFALCWLPLLVWARPLQLLVIAHYQPLLTPFYQEWFEAAGLEYALTPCTPARCERLIEGSEQIDGELVRVSGYESAHPALKAVGAPIGSVRVYASGSGSWPPAEGDQYGCQRGSLWCRRQLPAQRLTWLNDQEQGELMLKRGRIQWLIYFWPGAEERGGEQGHRLARLDYFLYLRRDQEPATRRLEEAQQRLMLSGRWRQMQQRLLTLFANQGTEGEPARP